MHLDSDGEEDGGDAEQEHHQDCDDDDSEGEDENARLFTQHNKEREFLLAGQDKGDEAAARQVPLPHSPPPLPAPSPQRQSSERPNLEMDVEEEILDAPTIPLLPTRRPTYEPPLSVMARVRSFLPPPPHFSLSLLSPPYPQKRPAWLSDSPQQQGRLQQQQQQRQHEDQPHLSVVNKHRLVLVNPEAFEDPDAVVEMVSAMKRVAVDGDIDGQEWARRAFELDRAFW